MKKLFYSLAQLKFSLVFLLGAALFLSSCEDEERILEDASFNYSFHNGQTVPSAPYTGLHPSNLSATLELMEMSDGGTMITVNLMNTIQGQTYRIHAHDAADPNDTANGTPYNESPNPGVFAQNITGNGGMVSISQESDMSFSELTSEYEGFLVVHDPLQAINTADITTYLIVGGFARVQGNDSYQSTSFNYDFNRGQLAEIFAYDGNHATDLSAEIVVDELADGRSRITVLIENTMDGQLYHSHAHDMADASVTPNGTPYNESPNTLVYASAIEGNGSTAGNSMISAMSYSEITGSYDGFFVVHDPLQTIDTTDPTSYVILGVFAR